MKFVSIVCEVLRTWQDMAQPPPMNYTSLLHSTVDMSSWICSTAMPIEGGKICMSSRCKCLCVALGGDVELPTRYILEIRKKPDKNTKNKIST